MAEALIRLEDKSPSPLSFSRGVDIFDDGRFLDVVEYPHAVIRIPGIQKEGLQFLLTPVLEYNETTEVWEVVRIRRYFVDADIINPSLVAELRSNRKITIGTDKIPGSIRDRVTGEIYNG